MGKKLSFEEQMIRRYATDRYHWIVGGWASSIVDLGNIVAWQYIEPPKEEA